VHCRKWLDNPEERCNRLREERREDNNGLVQNRVMRVLQVTSRRVLPRAVSKSAGYSGAEVRDVGPHVAPAVARECATSAG
jgi:hypothetical protein